MRGLLLTLILLFLLFILREDISAWVRSSGINASFAGYIALFMSGIVVAELLRPLFRSISAPARFVFVLAIAVVSLVGVEFFVQEGTGPAVMELPPELAPPSENTTVINAGFQGIFQDTAQFGEETVAFTIDTGAPFVLMNYDEAARIGIDVTALSFEQTLRLNDRALTIAKIVVPEIKIGEVVVHNVEAAVSNGSVPSTVTLGISYLKKLDKVQITPTELTLFQ
jgi:aspartyl protease family protein